MKLQDRIKERRRALGLTLLEVADALGVKEATVQRYESGEIKNLKLETINSLAKLFRCSPSYLVGWDFEDSLPPQVMEIKNEEVPMVGEIAAGKPILANEFVEYYSPLKDTGADFCLKVKGDSMIGAGITDGCTVFIHRQDIVEDGEIAAVLIDDEATLKRVYISEDSITLVAENPKYKPMIYSGEKCSGIRILGKAVSFMSAL
ncbi:MAG: helix-turn-helix domain-containing protein [Clostridia bacterium]|nr:helix-turn-helix domain-containing protein [Clostridia bacterium]